MGKGKTQETKERKAAGSSIAAQSKNLICELFVDSEKNDVTVADDGLVTISISENAYGWLQSLGAEISENTKRNLPPEMKLQGYQARQAELYQKAVVDGKWNPTPEIQAKLNDVSAKISVYEKKFAKKNATNTPESEPESETATA